MLKWINEKNPYWIFTSPPMHENHFTIVMSYMLLLSSTLQLSKVKRHQIQKRKKCLELFIQTFLTIRWLFNTVHLNMLKASTKTRIPHNFYPNINKMPSFNFYIRIKIKMFSMAHHKCQVTVFMFIWTCCFFSPFFFFWFKF